MPCAEGESPPTPVAYPTPSPTEAAAPVSDPTPSPTEASAPVADPTPSPTSSNSDLPNLTGPVKRELWTTQTSNKEGTYYGDWESNKAVTREKVQAVGACGISGVGTLPAYDSDV